MLPNIKGGVITVGSETQLRVGTNPSNAMAIALCTRFQASEDYQIQEAVCLGNLGPVSLDPQGYTCSITVDGFLPFKGKFKDQLQYADGAEGGKKALSDFIPERAKIMEQGHWDHKFAYLEFWNHKSQTVLSSFSGLIFANNGVNVDGNAYARNNVQIRALSWDSHGDAA